MRILHVTPTYFPATRYGGPIYSVHGLARAQALRGDDVQVFTTNVDGAGTTDTPLAAPVDRDGVSVCYFPCGVGRRLYRSPSMGEALSRAVPDVDVVHLHASFLWPTLAASRVAKRSAVPYVFAPRGMLHPELVRARSRAIKTLWIELFERKTVADAAAVHVTSEAERNGVRALGLRPKRIDVIANGVELPEIADLDPAAPQRIVCLGRISWKKGLDRLIHAVAMTTDAELVIAGNDDERLLPKLRALTQQLGIAHRVHFREAVHDAEKWRLLRSASIFALASHSENFGNAVLEAMASAIPVVVTPEVGLAPTIDAFGCGLVADGDPGTFGAALNDLLRDPIRRRTMGSAGQRLAETRFSWRVVADAMDALYREVARGQCRAPSLRPSG